MRKFLSVLLSLVIVFNTAFSAVKADTNTVDGQTSATSTTEVSVGEDVEGVKSPIMQVETDQNDSKFSASDEYADTDMVRVSIILKSPSTLEKYSTEDIASNKRAMRYRASLESKQDKVVSKIERALGKDLDVKWNLTLAANIISAEVQYSDIAKIAELSDVKKVVIEKQYEADEDTNTTISTGEMTLAQYAWANGYTGQGQLVAIIDTGTNQDHISFDGDALAYSLTKDGKSLDDYDLLTKEDIEKVLPELNISKNVKYSNVDVAADKLYKSLKIPFAFNYVDGNYKTDHASDGQGEHGSHVSGIAAANRYVNVDGKYVDALNSVYAVGVAPDAQIITMKVFGVAGGAFDSDYMAAIEDAIILGADSCNLSLGSGVQGFSFSDDYQAIMDSIVKYQTVVVMSAGNSYNFSQYAANDCEGGYLYYDDINFNTAGSPGSFVNSLGVASADNIGSTGTPLVFNGDLNVFYAESEGYSNQPIINSVGEYEYVYIDSIGTSAEMTAVNEVVSLEGKVVIVNRGTTSFYEKGNAAAAYKPVAIICANNKAGELNMDLTGYSYTYPFVSITLNDADKVKTSSTVTTVGNLKVYTGKVAVTDVITSGQTTERADAAVSEFSSWGIPGSLILKPEITAPGGNIYSVNGMTNDGYELMSGTSMAAPHVTGMAAILSQYIKDNDLAKLTNGNQRALINSLLMATATPMFDADGNYYPVLRQGAGLADVLAATKSLSFITMGEDATASYADGKVKAEFGDDPQRTGLYTYSFDITNFSDKNLTYRLSTDLFTQRLVASDDYAYLAPNTWLLDADVTYQIDEQHDVDKDGDTDTDDAQALLDYLTGVVDGSKLDLAAGEMDGVDGISSYDAELLLEWLKPDLTEVVVPAGKTKTVKVTIQLKDKDTLDKLYINGMYVEGYTYLDCLSQTEDGEILDVQKSIPLVGFYGNWTDASMYDTSLVEQYYLGEKPYSGVTSNYMAIEYPTDTKISAVIGNPYAIEDQFPADRLAISSQTKLDSFKYTLMRNAGAAGVLAYRTDEKGTIGETLYRGSVYGVYPEYYYVNGGAWKNTAPNDEKIGKTVAELGLVEDDMFNIGVWAVPEYYMMDTNGALTQSDFEKLVKSATLGYGAELGFDFTVDDTAPVVKSMELSEDKSKLTVTVSDNRYVAYVALMSLDGEKVYSGLVPEQTAANQDCTVEFDLTEAANESAVVLFVGDYAANEVYKLVKLSSGSASTKITAYFLTDKLEEGKEYIIASTNVAGKGYAMREQSYGMYNDGQYTAITEDTEKNLVYITVDEAKEKAVWLAEKGANGELVLVNKYYEDYLSSSGEGYKVSAYKTASEWHTNENGALMCGNLYLNFISNREWEMRATLDNPVYLYAYGTYNDELDLDSATEVVVTPEKSTLIMGVTDQVTLTATVKPVYLEDKSVTWKSSNEKVVTVDTNGVVTAVGVGDAVITATSNVTPAVFGTADVHVVSSNPMNATVNAQIMVGSDVQFVTVDLSDMSTTLLGHGAEGYPLVGGGRDGDYIYGVDQDDDVWQYSTDDYSGQSLFTMNPDYLPLDGANFPQITNGAVSADYDLVGVTESGMLLFFDMANSKLSGFDITTEQSPAVAVAYIGYYVNKTSNTVMNLYYLLSSNGEIYLWMIYNSGSNLGARYVKICDVKGLTIGADLSAYSMTYAYSATEEDALFIADNNSKSIYYVVLPADDTTTSVDATYVGSIKNAENISTLYDDLYDAVGKINSVVGEKAVKSFGKAVELTAKEFELAKQSTDGGVSASSSTVSPKLVSMLTKLNRKAGLAVKDDAEDSEVKVVEYTEDVDAKNGLVTVTYDAKETKLLKVESDVEFTSYKDENGTVKFAYAQTEAVEAGKTIVKFYFAATCEDSDVNVVTNEVNDKLALNEESTVTLEGLGHIWSFSEFVWSEDGESAKAKFVCDRVADHVLLVDAEVTTKVVKEPTYTEAGEKECKATVVFEQREYSESKTIVLPKLVPDTGDHSNIVLWTTVAAVSFISVVFAALMKKKAVKR